MRLAVAAALVVAFVTLLVRATTPHVTFTDGFGDVDGNSYARMVFALRGANDEPLRAPYVYRILPAALVAVSGQDVRLAFLALNFLAAIMAGALLAHLLRRYGAPPGLALLAVAWWAVLPASLRYFYYYPVILDGISFALALALIVLALEGRVLLFAAAVAAAVLVRESALAAVPFLWLARRDLRAAAVASLPALVTFAAIRLFPPIPPEKGFTLAEDVAQNVLWVATNTDGRVLRFALAIPLTLGLFALLPLAFPRASLAFLRREPAWAYWIVATPALALVGGGDYDRLLLPLVPLLAVLALAISPVARAPALACAALTALHIVASRFPWPVLGTDRAAYLEYSVSTMSLERLLAVAAITALALAVALPLVRSLRAAPPASR